MSNTAPIERKDAPHTFVCPGHCIGCEFYVKCSQEYNFWSAGADMSFHSEPIEVDETTIDEWVNEEVS